MRIELIALASDLRKASHGRKLTSKVSESTSSFNKCYDLERFRLLFSLEHLSTLPSSSQLYSVFSLSVRFIRLTFRYLP